MSLVSPMRWMLALAAVGLLCSSASAQGRPGQGGRGAGGGFQQSPGQEKLTYLASEPVQKELELADDQKADLKKLAEEAATKGRELFAGFGDFRNLSEEERNKRTAEVQQKREALGKDLLKKVEAVLLPHQMDRLQEIWVQVKGTGALTDPEIAKKLAITDTQKEKITEIRDTARREMFQGGGGGQGGFDRERFAKMSQERDAKVVAVLSADQKANFEKMKGEPFDVDAANLRFGGGQGGRPGQPGAGRPGQPGQGGQGGQQQRRRPGGDGNNNDR